MTRKNLKISMLSFFYIALVLHGLQRMSGLFIIELSRTKDITHQDAAIPFIYSWAVAKIVASFSHFLIGSKSSGLVVFCGVLLCAMGAALCILDTDITAITVFWGFIFGSGFGLASPYITRGLENVDSSKLSFFMEVPSSLGISVMPSLLNTLISQYGLQGSCIVFSGIILQYVPLALAAAYDIEIRIPSIKWRVRKKNSQYYVSKHEEENTISIENFISSLEPDAVLNINQCDNYHKIYRGNSAVFSNEMLSVGRKRSETKGNDLQGLEIDRNRHRTHYQVVSKSKSCEKIKKMFEKSFSNMDVMDVGTDCKGFKNLSVQTSEVTDNICTTNTNILNASKHDFKFKNKVLKDISQNEIKEVEGEEEEIEYQCLENSELKDQKGFNHTCIERPTSLITDGGTEFHKHQMSDSSQNDTRISLTVKQAENTSLSHNKCYREKKLDKETLVLTTQSLQNTPIFTIPLDIKVHVEEYTFTVDREYRSNSFDSSFSEDKSEINYSQFKFLGENQNFNHESQNASRNIKSGNDDKPNLSNIYSVLNNPKLVNKKNSEKRYSKAIGRNISKNELTSNFIRIFKFLNKIISPICLCIVFITIIFEISLITLLTNIGDIENGTDQANFDFKWILVAFGIGGLFGKLCCCKISRTISEKSHTVGVVLFLLTGLSIAGVLYSPNLGWLAVFYSILGALEGGISYILPKFFLDYTHKDVHHMISSMKNLLSGVAIICLPSVIGLLTDEMGDYEFLLQTLSCLLVLCALLAYFLPHIRSISVKKNIPSF